jgi:hypothetical protein
MTCLLHRKEPTANSLESALRGIADKTEGGFECVVIVDFVTRHC